jgi:AraC-like DNA-binding protein
MQIKSPGGGNFRKVIPGIEKMSESFALPRHRHLTPYATVVLSGTVDEAGYNGRIQAGAGDVLIHSWMDSHANCKVVAGLRLIRLDWWDPLFSSGLYQISNPDEIAIAAERDPFEASLLLAESMKRHAVPSPRTKNDWPDLLASSLTENVVTGIGHWARKHNLVPETVSRGFASAYGVSPEVFRAEARARIAWMRISRGTDKLSTIAAETGFADQAHMTRWVHRTSGATPHAWRQQHSDSSHQHTNELDARAGCDTPRASNGFIWREEERIA